MPQDTSAVNVFQLTREEMRAMVVAHADSVRANAAKVRAEIKPRPEGETRVLEVNEVLQDAVDALDRKAQEADYLAEHLAPGPYVMSGAELLGFKMAFAVFDLNIDKLVFQAMTMPKPDEQAERKNKSLLVKVPRLVLPDGTTA